jgi:hypothetical protein
MRVLLESSGGFAGLRLSSSLDTDELPPDQAAEAMRALEKLTSVPPAVPSGGTTLPQYRLIVSLDTGAQVLELTESQVPPALRPLLSELMRRARARPEQR